MNSLEVAVCTYDRYDLLSKALESLVCQNSEGFKFDILVVDNTPEAIRKEKHRFVSELHSNYAGSVRFIVEETPGLSHARNAAVSNSDADIIAFIDDDACAKESWAIELIKAFNSQSQVGCVGGRISPIWTQDIPSWLYRDLYGLLSVVDWGGKTREALESEWFAGANIAFDRRLIKGWGGFNTKLGRIGSGNSLLSNEETELLDKIKVSDYKAVYAPDVHVDHLVEEGRLNQNWFRRRMAWQATSDHLVRDGLMGEDTGSHLENVNKYLSNMPPRYRNIAGLYHEHEDPDMFKWQLSAIYSFSSLCLSGFPEEQVV